MSLDLEIEAMAARAEARAQRKVQAAMARWTRLVWQDRTTRAYRTIFLDTAGNLRPDAVVVIADIAATARLGVADPITATDDALRMRAGARALALHILGRLDLDGSRLRALAAKLREGPTNE